MPQFYLAKDASSKRHLLTRRDEAQKMDPNFVDLEIGSDKESIRGAVQELLTEADDLRLAEPSKESLDDIREAPEEFFKTAELKTPRRDVYEATDIEDFILNRALPTQVANIMQCLGTRMGEWISEKAGE